MILCKVSNRLEISGLPLNLQTYFQNISKFNTEAFQTEDIPAFLDLFERIDNATIKIPRGFLDLLEDLCAKHNLKLQVLYENINSEELNLNINPSIEYRTGIFQYQGRIVDELLSYKTCRLESSAGSGKTCMACIAIGLLNKGPILFLVNKDRLLRQFINTAVKILNVSEEDVGIIKASKYSLKPITVGSLQTLGKETFDLEKLKYYFNTIFFDECHISSALTYRRVLLGLSPERLYGLSATPEHYSSQELNNLMHGLLGPISVKVHDYEIPERLTPQTATRETGLTFYYNVSHKDPEWKKFKCRNKLYNEIATNEYRNKLIVKECKKLIKLGHKVLIMAARVAHCQVLANMLEQEGIILSFPYTIKERKGKEPDQKVNHKKLDQDVLLIEEGKIQALIGTYNLFQTGFDCRALSAIQFASPFSGENSTMLVQAIGRIQRHFFNKKNAIVLDYTDNSHPVNVLRQWSNDRASFMQNKYGRHEHIT